jgi:hypothetical protein
MTAQRLEMEERQRQTERSLGPLFELKPQKMPANWQCVRLTPKAELTHKHPEFVPAEMASSAYCLECDSELRHRTSGNVVPDHVGRHVKRFESVQTGSKIVEPAWNHDEVESVDFKPTRSRLILRPDLRIPYLRLGLAKNIGYYSYQLQMFFNIMKEKCI